MKRTRSPLGAQMKRRRETPPKQKQEYEGSTNAMISTGSTLLDLAITGGRIRGGGIPGGILVEVFGPSGSGKTVLLCELAGAIQRQGGKIMFKDPEARLDRQFARIFDLEVDEKDYDNPDTVPEAFKPVREWNPPQEDGIIHGIFTDSLAALSTDMEMNDGDAYGMRRAKEFSEECRKTCRVIKQKNFLMVCSNQVRINVGAGPYQEKHRTPGGEAMNFYSSLRLRFRSNQKLKDKKQIGRSTQSRVIGIETQVEVYKSSIWKPHREAPLTIIFDYGIDDIRQNLQYIKSIRGESKYTLGQKSLHNSINESIRMIEADRLEKKLREEVIDLWEEVESKFKQRRRKKKR